MPSVVGDSYLKQMLKTGTNLDTRKTNTDVSVQGHLTGSLQDTNNLFQNQTLRSTIEYTLWNNVWNRYGTYGTHKGKIRFAEYARKHSRGKMFFIDFGHNNMNFEFSFAHMGIVLADYKNLVLVLPVTSNRGQDYYKDYMDTIICVDSKKYPQFNKDSYLLLHQIRVVSKSRLLKGLPSIAKTDLMDEIEERIMQMISPNIKRRLEDIIVEKNLEIQQLREQIQSLSYQLEVATTREPTA